MAEAIGHGELRAQMTQHGLGTGIYGFTTELTSREHPYIIEGTMITQIPINNPLILQHSYEPYEGEYSRILELNKFTFLSTMLNNACYNLYNNFKSHGTYPTTILLKNMFVQNGL